MLRSIGAVAVATSALLGLVACEPPPPPATFHVTTGVDGADVAPGDGICETAPGNGECTLTAAVQEGNALGRAVIHVPKAEDYEALPPLTQTVITGDIVLRSTHLSEDGAVTAAPQTLTIAASGRLTLVNFILYVTDGLHNQGELVIDRSGMAAAVLNDTGARMVVVNSLILETADVPAALIVNRGTLLVRFSMLSSSRTLLHTEGPGASFVGATWFSSSDDVDHCTGVTPHSDGYNDSNCPLSGVGDGELLPQDAVPVGALGCGSDVVSDWDGTTRPTDGNGDGIAGCDAGYLEYPPRMVTRPVQ